MPNYLVSSEGPISVREVSHPGEGSPSHPWVPPSRPALPPDWEMPDLPTLPPRDEWPPLPPWLHPGVGLPIPPSPEHPMVPIDPSEPDGPEIWPPVRPEFPDMSGKTLALALVFVSRHIAKWHWVVIDHEDAKKKWQAIKDKLPAGGIGGRPPQTKPPQP